MATTTVPVVKAYLETLFKAAPGLTGVQVFRGHPGDTVQPELVMIGKVTLEQEWAALGARRKDEAYTVAVTVQVVQAGTDQDVVTERAYELVAAIEDALRNDVTLGGAVRVSEVEGWDDEEAFSDQGYSTVVDLRVAVKARI
jgi:hypothetical protein